MNQTIIESSSNRLSLNLKELVEYRELLWMMAYRDFKVRYAQTALGILWAIFQPLVTLIIFTLVFGKAIKVQTGDVPYPLFALAGMTLWTYFSAVMSQAGTSVVNAQNMVKKIYFPRLIIPISKSLSSSVDFGITLLFFMGMMVYYKVIPSVQIFLAPLFIIATIIAALGIGIWFSALTIRYRDLQFILPFFAQLGLYGTPVAYPASMVPEQYLTLYYLNPMAGIIEGFRVACFGGAFDERMWISFAVNIILFIGALFYFRKTESVMADLV
jgi:lipopolysaccharide transport system permease protein